MTYSLLNEQHITNAHLYINGKRSYYLSLELEQSYGEHHHFKIILDYHNLGEIKLDDPSSYLSLINKLIQINFQQGNKSSESFLFKGVITQVQLVTHEGKHGYVSIQGSSTTIMLERGKRLDIYSDMNLRSIFEKASEGVYHNYQNLVNNPTYTNKLDFALQYNESDWEFIKRLAYQYGENIFYSGTELLIGEYPEWEAIPLKYDHELSALEFLGQMQANHNSTFEYLATQDSYIERLSPEIIEGSNAYTDQVNEQSKLLTSEKPARTHTSIPLNNRSQLDEITKRHKSRIASKNHYIKGISKSYKTYIGRLIKIYVPDEDQGYKELGTYRVTKSHHHIDQNNHYSNHFEAVPASIVTMPMTKPRIPIGESIIGKVSSNQDPLNLGRVQVDFSFARQYSRIWMRVLSPNAGITSLGEKNRGLMFVPEEGDQVVVNFEMGNTNRPYVSGSLYHGKSGLGGGPHNHLKSITTRSGHTIEFDDAKDSMGITIKDCNGNQIHLDTKGKNIEITAPETMTLNAKNININAQENVNILGENMNVRVGANIVEYAKTKKTNIDEDYELRAKSLKEQAEIVDIYSHKENMTLYSKKNVETKSGSKKIRLS